MKRTALLRRTPLASTSTKPREPKEGACAHCGKPFLKLKPMQSVCGLRCAERKAKAGRKAKERAELEQTKARRLALKTIAQLIADAQAAFNAFIRERDRAKGCFVCERPFDQNIPGRALHAGHVRSRGAAGHLRFHEDNCLGECEGCNGPHGAKPHQIEAGAIRRIGQERFDALEADNTPRKWTREELIALKAEYRAKLRELRRAKA